MRNAMLAVYILLAEASLIHNVMSQDTFNLTARLEQYLEQDLPRIQNQNQIFREGTTDVIANSSSITLVDSLALDTHVPATTEDGATSFSVDLDWEPDPSVRVCNVDGDCQMVMEKQKVQLVLSTSLNVNNIVNINALAMVKNAGVELDCLTQTTDVCSQIQSLPQKFLIGFPQNTGAIVDVRSNTRQQVTVMENNRFLLFTVLPNWKTSANIVFRISYDNASTSCGDTCFSCADSRSTTNELTPVCQCFPLNVTLPDSSYNKEDLEVIFETIGQFVVNETQSDRKTEARVKFSPTMRSDWPSWANQWVNLSPSGWPTVATVDTIISDGADLVYTSLAFFFERYGSTNFTVQNPEAKRLLWGLDFSKAQFTLVSTFNEEQKFLVVFLNCLTRKHLHNFGINSYQMLTLIFHMTEQFGLDNTIWNNSTVYVTTAMQMLQQKLTDGALSDYFLRGDNLFGGFDDATRQASSQKVAEIIQQPQNFLDDNLFNHTVKLETFVTKFTFNKTVSDANTPSILLVNLKTGGMALFICLNMAVILVAMI